MTAEREEQYDRHDQNAARLLRSIAVNNDRAAFAILFTRFAPRVKAYLMCLGMHAAQAEEHTQDVMLTMWQKAAQYDPARASADAWIFTIARNLRIDAARRAGIVPVLQDPVDEPPPVPHADVILVAQDRQARVRAALASLPEEQVAVIQLSFFDDRPHAEIERALGVPLGTVKSRLRLALARLRRVIGEDI